MANHNNSIVIRQGLPSDALELALMHKNAINQGFLSQLPLSFLSLLYQFLIKNELVFVASGSHDRIIGFISATKFPSGLFVRFIKKHGLKAGFKLISYSFKKGFLKKMIETSIGGNKSSFNEFKHVPELLSIVTQPDEQTAGIGSLLLNALQIEMKHSGFNKIKVVAGKQLQSANNFYKKKGFKIVAEISIHRGEGSYLYIKEI